MTASGTDGEYPDLPDGSKVPFTPAGRQRPTAEDVERALSKHAPGAVVPKKSRFPEGWTDSGDIVAAIDLTTADPDTVVRRGDKITFDRDIEGELVRVHVRVDGPDPIFRTAFPPNGRIAT